MGLSGGPRGSYRRRYRRKYRALRRRYTARAGQWREDAVGRPQAPERGYQGEPRHAEHYRRAGESWPDAGWREAGPGARRSHRARSRRAPSAGVLPWGVPLPAAIAAAVTLVILIGAAVGTDRWVAAGDVANTAAAPNPNCTLIVPANPLTAQGLATPYQLTATNPADGPCNEANATQTAFVQGAVINPATGAISVYNPLVIDAGTQPAQPPVVPTLPAGAVVAVWFGYNGNVLSFEGADQAGNGTPGSAAASPSQGQDDVSAVTASPSGTPTASSTASVAASASAPASPSATATASPASASPSSASPSATAPLSGSASASASSSAPAAPSLADGPAASGTPDTILQQANCVAGQVIGGQFTSFSQVGACNAVAFFQAANAAIAAGKLNVPTPGTAKDGLPCLTTRSFALIDQDQSDNVTTHYLATASGQTAQDTTANQQALGGAMGLANGSDNGLVDFFMDPALGCSPWTVPDLANGGAPATALPLNELMADQYAGKVVGFGPAALVPTNDPMVLDGNGNFNEGKTNTYRAIMDMPALPAGQSPAAYCSDMEIIQGKRLQQDVNLLIGAPSPAPGTGDNLFTFLASRLQASFMNLNCGSFGLQNDVSTSVDGNGVVVAACFLNQVAAITPGAGNPTRGMTTCPATVSTAPSASASASATPAPTATSPASATPTASAPASSTTPPSATPSATSPASQPTASAQPTSSATQPAGSAPPTASAHPTGTSAGPSASAPGSQRPPSSQPPTASHPASAPPPSSTPQGQPTSASAPVTLPTFPSPPAVSATGTTGTGGTAASSGRGWHDSGWSYTSRGNRWPGLGPDWAHPNPRRQWLSAAWTGAWTSITMLF